MYKLIKLLEGYIITSTEEIKEKDFIIERGKPIVKCKAILDCEDLVWESLNTKSSACDGIFNFKKIIASTFIKELPSIDFNGFEDKVGASNKDWIVENAENYCQKEKRRTDVFSAYLEGWNKHKELNKDKLYTLEDMEKCYNGLLQNVGTSIKQSDLPTSKQYIEHLSPPKQWNIGVEMEQYTQNLHKDIWYNQLKITNNSIKITNIL